jgi:hypothetical protein
MQVRLRLSDQIGAAVRQHAGQRRVHLHDHLRHLVERGLLIDAMTLCRVPQSKPPGLSEHIIEAVLETRNLLRVLLAARDPQIVNRAQAEAQAEAKTLAAMKE